jgi:hypothetical protein
MIAKALLKPELYRIVRPKIAQFDDILRIVEPNHVGIKTFFRLHRFAFSDAQEHLGVRRNFLCRLQRADGLRAIDHLKILAAETPGLLIEFDSGANRGNAVIEIKEPIRKVLRC